MAEIRKAKYPINQCDAQGAECELRAISEAWDDEEIAKECERVEKISRSWK